MSIAGASSLPAFVVSDASNGPPSTSPKTVPTSTPLLSRVQTPRGLSPILRTLRLRIGFPWVDSWIQSNLSLGHSQRTQEVRCLREPEGVSESLPQFHLSKFVDSHFAMEHLLWLRCLLASPRSTPCGETSSLGHWPWRVVQLLPWGKVQR